MTALRLALNELRRLTSGKLPRLGLIAILLVPTLYGGLYLYANNDPYAGLSWVPAAIVVEDAGTTLANGERLNAGPTVAHDLVASRSFDWHEVDRAEATSGVADGRNDFALIVPRAFSGDLASSAEFTPRQAHLEVATNDANNYIAHTIANQVVAQVTKSVAEQVSSTAANQLLLGFSTIHTKVTEAVDGEAKLTAGILKADKGAGDLATGAGQLVTGETALVKGTTELRDGATEAAAGATTLASGSASLATGLGTLDSTTATLPAQTRALADGARKVSDGNTAVAAAGTRFAAASQQFIASMTTGQGDLATALADRGFTQDQIDAILAETGKLSGPAGAANAKVQQTSAQLNVLSAGAQQVAAGADRLDVAAGRLAVAAGPLHAGIHQAAGGAVKLRDGAASLSSGADRLSSGATSLAIGQQSALDGATKLDAGARQLGAGLDELGAGATKLHDGLATGLRSIPNPSEASRKAVAQTIGNPIAVANTSQATAGSYGAGLAPFFLSLALWIGAYVLFLLVKPLSSRALAAGQPAWRIALGGWLSPALFGLVQGSLVFTVVFIGLGSHAEHPAGVLALMAVTSIAFVAILHALVSRLGAVGKFLGLVFMVLQLVSAGGTFPWQTVPLPLHALHHVLPMGYAIDAIRRLMYGGSLAPVAGDVAVLTAYLLLALTVSTYAARRARVWTPARAKPELVL